MRLFKIKPTFIAMPTLPLQNNTALKTTLKSFFHSASQCFYLGFFFPWISEFYLWDQSRGCCCSVQPSASCLLETLCSECCRVWGTEKHKNPHTRAPRSSHKPHPALPAHQKFRLERRHRVRFKKFIPRLNSKGKMISPCNLWEWIQGSRNSPGDLQNW